ncbi:hypothetical protein COU56_01800 [Candidatus Pacearchaeota archaeon CG10_big_fil_rev_8_21_14_0_10_31_9]|nr:MAG: hypothetical protein COU56_01800 [Candidatus Pacearchaeota archaeon CG10_big_fil_rev_8_21_14_0_10_31_9]
MAVEKRTLKWHHYFVIFVYLTVGLAILSLLIINLNSKFFGITGNYLINAEENDYSSKLGSFYIDKTQVLGNTKELNGNIARPFISQETFNIVFKPKTVIPDNSTGILGLNLIGTGDLYINDKLVIPDLENYELLVNTQKDQVYVKKSILKESYINSESALDFIYKNYPASNIYYFSNTNNIEIPKFEDYNRSVTFINTSFRGDLKLAIYVEDNLTLSFTKQDLNDYVGKDEYALSITDINNKVYFNKNYEDDGEIKNSNKIGAGQNFNITLNNLPGSIYYLTFSKDRFNDAPDSSIKNIKINSNKVVFIGNILPWSSFEVYTKVQNNKSIGFLYWWSGKDQIISIPEYREKEIVLDKDWVNKRYNLLLYSGDYEIKSDVGYLWIYTDVLSTKPNSFFVIPLNKENNKFNSQDIIVIDKSYLNIDENDKEMSYFQDLKLEKETKVKMKVIGDSLYLKNITLELKE